MARKNLTPDEFAERGIPLGESGGPQDEGPPPKFGTPIPVIVEDAGSLPRECKELERASGDLKRFKIRAEPAPSKNKSRYVLARKQAEAEACYRKTEGLDDDAPLATVELPD